ncbi:glycoside hydrolase 5 family protein [Mucisphaera calidilacus]|uniref:Glycoside hydrolase family 42 N-terminal domain-containing protein n=1 Tax=Mucisphaera calidilacus TaxID=2527982 RepID=A0A518BWX1_9BACT|nr:hypothetical protein [Mucisphaera calidilacus]QDU71466.1 hypothetical protein Pan265_13160 [Mucisphaera calidilacus]
MLRNPVVIPLFVCLFAAICPVVAQPANPAAPEQEDPRIQATPEPEVKLLLSEKLGLPGADTYAAQRHERHKAFSLMPRVDMEPGFTTSPHGPFYLDLAAVARKEIEVEGFLLNGEALPPDAWSVLGTRLTLRPDRELRRGFNIIEFQYRHPDKPGKADELLSFSFWANYQPDPTPVAYGSQGELIVDGKPLFVVGSFRSGQTDRHIDALPTAQAAGVSWVHDYKNGRVRDLEKMGFEAFLEQARAYLRRAHELGLGVAMSIPRPAVVDADEAFVARWVSELSDEPALWFWYLYDEPKPQHVPVTSISKTYKTIKRMDPNHPVVLVCHLEETNAVYHPFTDAMWPDRYPITATGREMVTTTPVYSDIQRVRQLIGPDQPIAPVLQLHDNRSIPWLRKSNPELAMPSDADHRPTADEVRAMGHLALVGGARGFSYYWAPTYWYSLEKDAPQHWKHFTRVVHEFRDLEPIVLADEPDVDVSLQQPAGGKTMQWSRVHDAHLYIAAVNTDVYNSVEVTLPVVRGVSDWSVHSAYAGSRLNGNRLVLGPSGVIIVKAPWSSSE